ncbi:MAG: winged helix-turn-helix domain-containing protein, partial [Acidimicrobiales bacterium]
MVAMQPTGTVTFLFTDIQGSTRLWRDQPDQMTVALARHDEIVKQAIADHDGYIFSTGGDGFAAAFHRAGDAVGAADRTQRELLNEPWDKLAPIRVRMGIHTGEADERDGDYFGLSVSQAGRLMAHALDSQVLLSAMTAELVSQHWELADLGEQEIRDHSGPARVFALRADGLVTTPGPKTGAAPSTIRFGPVEVDPAAREVRHNNVAVAVEPQVFGVLVHLIANNDRVVSKEELLDEVWGDRFVSESALTSRIKAARKAVGDDGRRQDIIRTVHGTGYRFVAAIETTSGGPDQLYQSDTADEARPTPGRELIGRETEVAEVSRMLERSGLVTVLGPGGVGKTTLAREVARRWEQNTTQRAVIVQLSPLSDPGQVLPAVSAALGIGSSSSDHLAALHEAVRHQPILLVLDNLEHLLDAAGDIAALLAFDAVRLLVTSRERVRLKGEQIFELAPLAVFADAEITDGQLSRSPAVELFLRAARSAQPDFV